MEAKRRHPKPNICEASQVCPLTYTVTRATNSDPQDTSKADHNYIGSVATSEPIISREMWTLRTVFGRRGPDYMIQRYRL